MDADVLEDARVAEATERHGPLGAAAWLYVLCQTKLQRDVGRVTLVPLLMGRALRAPRADAEAALQTLVELGLLASAGGDEYDVPRWLDVQPDERGRKAQAARKALHPGRKRGRPRNAPKCTEMPQEPTEMQGPGTIDQDHGGLELEKSPSPSSSAVAADPDSVEECDYLADLIERNGSKRPSVTKAWLQAADRLKRLDGKTHAQVMTCIEWCQQDEFWRGNILSMPTLRKQYDRLRLAAGRAQTGTGMSGDVRRAELLTALGVGANRPKEIGDGTSPVG